MQSAAALVTAVALVTFEILTRDFDAFRSEFAKLSRKAAKLGVAAPSFAVVQADKVIPAVTENVNGFIRVVRPARVVHVVTVSGERPRIGGWTFAAALQHETAGNIVRTVPGVEIQISRDLRTAKPACEHCGLDRRRADTYVVAHDDGRQMQVGRSCLRDFTGHDSPETIARWAELLSVFVSACGGDEDDERMSGGAWEAEVTTLDGFLPVVCASIRADGWLSRTKAREAFPPMAATADVAWSSIFPKTRDERENAVKPTAQDIARAAELISVARAHFEAHAIDALPDYEHNLRIVVESVSVTSRTAGIAASLVGFVERLIGREIEQRKLSEQRAASVHVGTVGKREIMTLTVEKVIDVDSQYGTCHLHILRDSAGNAIKWFSSSARLDVGKTYAGKCTVKSHDEYKGTKQTMLTRCKLEPVTAAAEVK